MTAKVIDLINKLLALSKDGGATEAEAQLAAEKAQELMTQHNLSMATVEAAGGDSGEAGTRVKDETSHRQVYNWQKQLMASIAELNFCHCRLKYDVRRGYGGMSKVFNGYQLIGRAANVASTRVMFDYLVQSINRLAKADLPPKEFFTRYGHSYKEGCADRLVERLQAKRRAEIEEQERSAREQNVRNQHPSAATGNALVIVLKDVVQNEKDLNEDFINGLPPGTTARNRAEYETRTAELNRKNKLAYDQRRAALLAETPDIDLRRLDWLASGFSPETVDRWLAPSKPETETQKRKREEREERDRQRQRDKYNREAKRLDWRAYDRGQSAADNVGLDQQVDKNQHKQVR